MKINHQTSGLMPSSLRLLIGGLGIFGGVTAISVFAQVNQTLANRVVSNASSNINKNRFEVLAPIRSDLAMDIAQVRTQFVASDFRSDSLSQGKSGTQLQVRSGIEIRPKIDGRAPLAQVNQTRVAERSANQDRLEADRLATQPISQNQSVSDNQSLEQARTQSRSILADQPAAKLVNYQVRYLDGQQQVMTVAKQATIGSVVEVVAEDLFDRGYELLDISTKSLIVNDDRAMVTFQVGKAREKMSLTEFTRREVNYDYPLRYRDLDFTGRQAELEEFVIKMIYQGEKNTGKFYGTKDQADQIRKTLLNGSFQGAYARYATNMVPELPKLIAGDKYEHLINFTYQEHLEDIKLGEAKVTEFVNKYGTDYTDAEKAKLIHDWLMKNTKIFNPPHNNQEWFYNTKKQRRVHFPASLLLDGEGVCLSYAMTYGRLAERMGLEVRLIQGYAGLSGFDRAAQAQNMFDNPDSTTYHPGFLNHTWNLVKIDRAWHHIDTFQDMGFLQFTKKNPNPYRYFLQSDEYMRQHQIKMGAGRLRDYTVNRAWNTNRIPTAHSAKNEFWVMRDRSEKDLIFN